MTEVNNASDSDSERRHETTDAKPKVANTHKLLKKRDREICWNARDTFLECLKTNELDETKCITQRKCYENSCPRSWVAHFERKINVRSELKKDPQKIYQQ